MSAGGVRLVPAEAERAAEYAAIIDDGRAFQRAQGFVQWTDDTPNIGSIRADIASGHGYALTADGVLAGYLCLSFDGEPAYDALEGEWHTSGRYAVVHRMAISAKFRGMGLSSAALCLAEEICRGRGVHGFRIDTGLQNARMRHILEKNGFCECGICYYSGSPRVAYDKNV